MQNFHLKQNLEKSMMQKIQRRFYFNMKMAYMDLCCYLVIILQKLNKLGIIEIDRGRIRRLRNNGEEAESLTREHSWPVAATNQIDYFCRVIKGEKENMGDPEYHLQHVSFIDACYKSKREGIYINPKKLLADFARPRNKNEQ